MGIDNVAVIESEGARVVSALEADRDARVPWSDHWTVQDVAHHVGGVHHVVAQLVDGRPEGDFSLFSQLESPDQSDPALAAWVAEGTAALVGQLRATDPEAECWSWWPDGRSAGWWQRRMAQETLVHRWDAELGAGIPREPMDPAVAADGIDEFLDVFTAVGRMVHSAPSGPSVHVHCTDTEGEWLLGLSTPGGRDLTREHAKGDTAMRGPAEALLLLVWGRALPEDIGVEVIGDRQIIERWKELLPSL
jgi:uncharacterized protein (TIGR03083 family)